MARDNSNGHELRPEEREVGDVIRREFAFLSSLGYGHPRVVIADSRLVGRMTSWIFSNTRDDRNCEVLLNQDRNDCDLDLIIWKKSAESESADPLYFDMYLKAHRPDVDPKRLLLGNYPPPLGSQVTELLKIYRSLLAEEAIDILKGRRWEGGHYVDWTA